MSDSQLPKGPDDAVKAGLKLREAGPEETASILKEAAASANGIDMAAILSPLTSLLERRDTSAAAFTAATKAISLQIASANPDKLERVAIRNELAKSLKAGKFPRPAETADTIIGLAGALLASESGEDGEEEDQFTKVLNACESAFEFFADNAESYLCPGDNLAVPLDSQKAVDFVRRAFYEEHGKAVGSETVAAVLGLKRIIALHDGPFWPVFRRVGRVGDTHYLDLCREGKVVEITSEGWKIVTNPDGVFFKRKGSPEEALPTPEPGGDVMLLRQLVNTSESMVKLLVAWLITALRDSTPYVTLVIEGEAGSAKSTLTRILKYLIDPVQRMHLLRTFPDSERDFAIACLHEQVVTLDNASKISPGQSDMLCRAATGGSFSARTHYSMTDETVIGIMRPIIITGIHGLVSKSDMASRVALIQLDEIPDDRRMTEQDVWTLVDEHRPQILGGLLDGFVAALANLESVHLKTLPRMADFAKFITAAESGLPWTKGEALQAFLRTQGNLYEQALERDRVALSIVKFMEYREEWEGTTEDLLSRLEPGHGGTDRWPTTPTGLASRIRQAIPLLREKSIRISKRKSGSKRVLRLYSSRGVPEKVSQPSQPSQMMLEAHEMDVHGGTHCGTPKKMVGTPLGNGGTPSSQPSQVRPTADQGKTCDRDTWDTWDTFPGTPPEGDLEENRAALAEGLKGIL